MIDFRKLLDRYDYKVPERLIAQKPAAPRDSAKLLVYRRKDGKISYDKFFNIAGYLPKNAVLVLNKTKVLPARLAVKKETGGRANLLYIRTIRGLVEALSDRKLNIGSKISVTPKLFFVVRRQNGKYYHLKPLFPIGKMTGILQEYGQTPIPPYMKRSPLSEAKLREKYQSVFAKNPGSIAAPTASLHFTKRLLHKIEKRGFKIKFVTLHVGLGTFAPLTEENFKKGKLHTEYFGLDKSTASFLNKAKRRGQLIIAVGTTAARALESATNKTGKLIKISGKTNLFIQEEYEFKFINGIITNFHVPRSNLLMLIAAFIGREKLLEIYGQAQKRSFRFFSFGDGMLII